MAFGDAGKEQFRNCIVTLRNHHIAAGLSPLMLLRSEITHSEDLADRGGLDTPSRDHFLQLLINADRWRRRLTHNPGNEPLGDLIAKAIDASAAIEDSPTPFGGDNIQMGSTSLYDIPFDLSGADKNIPLNGALTFSNNGRLLLGSVDATIVAWTRLNSRDRSRFITRHDSLRIYGLYQQIMAYLQTFAGDENRVDVAQVEAMDEPRGPENSPNRRTETSGGSAPA